MPSGGQGLLSFWMWELKLEAVICPSNTSTFWVEFCLLKFLCVCVIYLFIHLFILFLFVCVFILRQGLYVALAVLALAV